MPYDKNGKYYRKPVYRDQNSIKKEENKKVISKYSYILLGFILFLGIFSITSITIDRRAKNKEKRNLENIEAVKEGLKNGYDECKERWENKQTTKFTDIPSFFVKYDGFEIKRNPNTKIKKIRRCFIVFMFFFGEIVYSK